MAIGSRRLGCYRVCCTCDATHTLEMRGGQLHLVVPYGISPDGMAFPQNLGRRLSAEAGVDAIAARGIRLP